MTQLATAIGQTVSAERVALYCRGLNDIGEAQLLYGFEQALRHLGEFLPSIQQLRGFAEQWRPVDVVMDNRFLLDRGSKPPGWEPLRPGELELMRAEAAERARIIRQAVAAAAQDEEKQRMPSSDSEFEARRQRQLDEFRRRNRQAGEA